MQVTLVSDCLKDLLEHELSAIEAQVLSLRYGLDDGAALSWKQIAQRCGMPEKQLQLAQSRALRKLRKQRALRQLQGSGRCDEDNEAQHRFQRSSRSGRARSGRKVAASRTRVLRR